MGDRYVLGFAPAPRLLRGPVLCRLGSVVLLNVLGCRLTYEGQAETSAEAWFNIASRPRKPEGSLGRTAQDGHLDSHTAPELRVCRLYKNPTDETTNRAPPVCIRMQKDHICNDVHTYAHANAWIGTHAMFPVIPKRCCRFSVVQSF